MNQGLLTWLEKYEHLSFDVYPRIECKETLPGSKTPNEVLQ